MNEGRTLATKVRESRVNSRAATKFAPRFINAPLLLIRLLAPPHGQMISRTDSMRIREKETQPLSGRQLIVVSSEKQAKVLTLPSQLTLPPDNGCLMKSNVDISSHGACLASSGNILCPLVGCDL
ncbi:unnamed protein product [Clavelina lepadiformis]|uniref:Uncharacterized protein n=1 Tax=Clavelina lepadiformis TaxID=159417 RepID=A0ABP0G8F1_CLALP